MLASTVRSAVLLLFLSTVYFEYSVQKKQKSSNSTVHIYYAVVQTSTGSRRSTRFDIQKIFQAILPNY